MSRWLERLLNKKGKLSDYADAAQNWATCAVGEVHEDFPNVVLGCLNENDAPADQRLETLGLAFGNAVEKNERTKALKLYRAIQQRVENLIRKGAA